MNRLRLFVLPVIAVAALSIAACSSGSNDNASPAASYAEGASGDEDSGGTDARLNAPAAAPVDGLFATTNERASAAGTRQDTVDDRAVIQTGSVSLRSNDVGKTRFELQKVIDRHEGLIDDERTETDRKGVVRMSRVVVRVPSADFDKAMTEISGLGTLVEATRKAKDVTTQVIDTDARIRAQEASLARVEALLARAQNIRTIIAIESQLTRRQADLDALKRNQAYLADQTEMSTITVYLEKAAAEKAAAAPKKHHTPFVAGLVNGWDAFTDVAGGLAKATGASLPFLAVLILLAWPFLLVVRRFAAWSRRTTTPEPTEA